MDASSKDANSKQQRNEPVRFAIVGGGWRAEFYLRIARELPQRFQVSGVLIRNEEKRRSWSSRWDTPAVETLDELLESRPVFVVVSVPWAVSPLVIRELAQRDIPVLAETPPAPDLESLAALYQETRGAKIQVAEQYLFQPLHAARLKMAAAGRLGRISQAQISVAHGYHGISLLRHFLKVKFENATIMARNFTSPLIAGPGRNGPPQEEQTTQAKQTIATFDFGDRLGMFDFSDEQYFSWIRSPRVLVRGERGEINNSELRYLQDFRTPGFTQFQRRDTGQDGNLEGHYHQGIVVGGEWIYRNPFVPARLSDDEIAVATCLEKMREYSVGGASFYSLAEASQDHYLGLMMDESLETGMPVETASQLWAQENNSCCAAS